MSVQIGKVFSQIVKERRYTIKEISKVTEVPASTLAEWQAGRIPKNPAQVRVVAQFLKVSLHFLLFGEEDSQQLTAKLTNQDLLNGVFEISIRRIYLKP